MNNLIVKLKSLENPYSNEKSSMYDLWGQIIISIEDEILVNTQWDIAFFIDWFYKVQNKLKQEIFPFKLVNSIAKTRDLLYAKENFPNEDEEDSYCQNLEKYFSNHNFHLSGTDTLHFYIGLINSQNGEISYKVNDKYYSHIFIMDDFINHANKAINIFLDSIESNMIRKNG
jgi:hypothetical protein